MRKLPVFSDLYNLNQMSNPRGQTPPPASHLRGSHFDDPSHYQSHFQAAGAAYPPQAFVDMNKPASARVAGPGLAQAPQSFNVGRQPQNYNLVGDAQDPPGPPMWSQQGSLPGSYFMRQTRMPGPMNNSQVAFMQGMTGNMTAANIGFLPNTMPTNYGGNQGMPVQYPNSQFVQLRNQHPGQVGRQPQYLQQPGCRQPDLAVQQQQQFQPQRMQFPAAMPPQQQMNYMPPYGPASAAYNQTFYQQPMPMPSTSRPSSAGPQGAMGGGPKPPRNRKMLSLTDPNTGEDLTEKVFKPMGGEDLDPAQQESQAHRTKVHLEFATKVAFLAKDKHPAEGSHAIQITAPPVGAEAMGHHPVVMEEPPPAAPAPTLNVHAPPHPHPHPHPHPLVEQQQQQPQQPPVPQMNGEPETNIPEQVISVQPPPAPYSSPPPPPPAPAKKEELAEPSPPPQPVETVATAAASPEVQTPSPALPAAPAMPVPASPPAAPVANVAASKDVSPPPAEPPCAETSPPPSAEESTTPAAVSVVEKSPSPVKEVEPVAAVVEKEASPTPPPDAAESAAPAEPEIPSGPVEDAQAASTTTTTSETTSQSAGGRRERKKNKKRKDRKTTPPVSKANAPQTQTPAQQTQKPPQPAQQPQPQRDGGKKGRKNKRELNKKSKEGSDMDAFYDPQPEAPKQEAVASRETSPKAATPASSSSTSPPPSTTSQAAAAEVPQAAAASAPAPEVSTPAPEASTPAPEASTPPPEASTPAPEASTPAPVAVEEPSASAPEAEVEEPPAPEPVPEPKEPSPIREPLLPKPPMAQSPAKPPMYSPAKPAAQPPAEVVKEPSPEAPSPKAEEEENEEEKAKPEEEEQGKENGEVTESDLVDIQSRLVSGLGLNYKDGQWSPLNPEGKKQYDREFLLKLQGNPESRKPPALPHMPEICVDPRIVKSEDFQRAQMAARVTGVPDFTPGFFKSFQRPGASLTKRNSQQGRRGPGSQSGEGQQRIILSTRQEVQLHKTENAYRPQFQQTNTNAPEEPQGTEGLLRQFQSILNKLTPEKLDKLSAQALGVKIDSEARLEGVTNLIFEKAIDEQKFARVYAEFCNNLLKLPKVLNKEGREVTFRGVLLTKCQKEFEKDKLTEKSLETRKKELEDAAQAGSSEDRSSAQEELAQATKKARHRSMGNIRFIGELFRLKMLTENIMHDCIFKLLKQRDDESIECLTKLLDTVGKDLDHPKAKHRMDQYFAQLEKMTAGMQQERQEKEERERQERLERDRLERLKRQGRLDRGDRERLERMERDRQDSQDRDRQVGGKNAPKDKLSSRVKFGVLDILDMRRDGWVKRKYQELNQPTTLNAIHQKAKEEEQTAQFLNNQPRPEPSAARGGARPKGRGSAQGGDADGWNTVPARQVKQQIEPTRMKLTKTNIDANNVTLGGGNKFQNWGRGSQGGGSRSQEQEKLGNRYNALNNLTDSDGRRNYGRSPARGDSRGSGRMDRDLDRRDRDRDFRRPVARSSMEERERAVANTRSLLGASGGTSNPSSRNASRDNSRSREAPAEGAKKVVAGVDASKMSQDELDRRTNTIVSEFIENANIKETQESIAELKNLDYSLLIIGMLEKLIEKNGSKSRQFGQFLFHMVKEKVFTTEDLIKGIAEFLQVAEDLELDLPKIWDYMAEILAALLVDNKILPFNFLQACLGPLTAMGSKKEVWLLTRALKVAGDIKGKEVIQAQWAASGLKLSDFGLTDSELHWLMGPARNVVYQEVCRRLQKGENNEEIFQWIDKNVKREERDSNQFARELFTAICRNSINDNKKADTSDLKKRVPLVRKYVDTQEKGTQALFAVQHLMCELEHPQGLVRTLFELFYDEDMISEDSFFDWEARDGPPEDMVGKGVVKMNLKSFLDWLRSSNDDDRTS
ncbi:uncharacterized protein LOC143301823 isoform X2 [Babylonia areolata]|uniref:uncharacterized protein LOC143301823 isoform X2 n=2 Tax=Babylonia areolata TaxID=304850 RepID=UPI003FD0E10B